MVKYWRFFKLFSWTFLMQTHTQIPIYKNNLRNQYKVDNLIHFLWERKKISLPDQVRKAAKCSDLLFKFVVNPYFSEIFFNHEINKAMAVGRGTPSSTWLWVIPVKYQVNYCFAQVEFLQVSIILTTIYFIILPTYRYNFDQ